MSKPAETKLCGGAHGCGEERWIEEFRMLSSGSRAAYCRDCELRFDKWRKGRSAEELPAGLRPDELSGPELIDELLAEAGLPEDMARIFSGDVTVTGKLFVDGEIDLESEFD